LGAGARGQDQQEKNDWIQRKGICLITANNRALLPLRNVADLLKWRRLMDGSPRVSVIRGSMSGL
jgi:hypothetical protein